MRKFAITGPESSGKTTLSCVLAENLQALLIPEFARAYLMKTQGKYAQKDLVEIAKGQIDSWKDQTNSGILISDTEMIVLKIWSEFKYGKCDPYILQQVDLQEFEHYFLCRPDIPWEKDDLREHPEHREELFERYLYELQKRKLPFTIIEGSLEDRLVACTKIIDANS